MADKRPVVPVKPICAVTFSPEVDLENVMAQLGGVMGRVEKQSAPFAFDYTRYYADEMGSDLTKQFYSFEGLIHPGQLPALKTATNALEQTWAESGNRSVNLDPGYVTGAKLVLASAKDYSHRLFLADGIYGDVQLRFQHGHFVVSEWTYPDYQSDLAFTFFEDVRIEYLKQEKKHGENGL